MFELGVGARPIPRKQLTPDKLAAAIHAALAPEICAAAKDLGQKICQERGAEMAARVIIDCVQANPYPKFFSPNALLDVQ